jgi:diguanylate cyclase (GGDEF)-like protein
VAAALPASGVIAVATLGLATFGSTGAIRLLTPLVNFVLILLLALVLYGVSRLDNLPAETRRFWRITALALAVDGVGMAVDFVARGLHAVLGVPLVEPGSAVIIPVAGLLTMYAMFQYPTTARTRSERVTVSLDVGVVLVGTAAFFWYLSVSRVWIPEDGLFALSAAVATPAMTLVAGFGILKIAAAGAGVIGRPSLALFGLSVLLAAAANAATPTGEGVSWLATVVGVTSQVAGLAGAVLQYRASASDRVGRPFAGRRRAFSVLPYGASIAAFLLMVIALAPSVGWRQWGVVGSVGLLVAVVIVRQLVAMRENARLLAHNSELAARLQRQAWHDELTGLPNRSLFTQRIRDALEACRGGTVRSAVFLVDLDDFKQVNDTFGHDAGDEVLRMMADRLTRAVRPADTVYRLGGDEFVVIAENVDERTAHDIAERLHRTAAEPVLLRGGPVSVGASVGVALADRDTHDPSDVLRRADAAMYAVKASGKGGWQPCRATAGAAAAAAAVGAVM